MTESKWTRAFRLGSRSVESDVDDEVAFHFQMRVEQFVAQGMPRADAERAARAQFGDVAEVRSMLVDIGRRSYRRRDWRDRWDGVRADIVVSLRTLGREPIFALGVIATLAIGIGANATIFGVVDRLLLRGPEHIVAARDVRRLYLTVKPPGVNGPRTISGVGYVTYATLRDQAKSFAGVAGFSEPSSARYGPGADARAITEARATWDLFPLLGVKPVLGRFFGSDEDKPPRGENVVVLGEEFWRSEFGGDRGVIGRRIVVNDAAFIVVGVAPRGFTGPERAHADVWTPMSLAAPRADWPTTYQAQWMRVVTRLKAGASAEQAGLEATQILRAAYNGPRPFMREMDVSFRPLWYGSQGQPTRVARVSLWLAGVAALVLVITCANVANLLLVRTRRRRREIAVRLALGIGRARLVRLLLTETMIVAVGGGLAALVVAAVGSKLMRASLLADVVWTTDTVDTRLFAFTMALAAATGLVVGLVPALESRKVSLSSSLKTGGGDGGGRRQGLRMSLSVVQSAVSVILLVGAGLFVQSLMRVRSVNLGFEPERVLRAYPGFVGGGDKQNRTRIVRDALAQLQRLPWVEHAAITVGSPYGFAFSLTVTTPGRDSLPSLPGGGPFVSAVSSDYFATLGVRMLRGRTFTADEREGGTLVAVISETMAKLAWPNEDALGKCLMIERVKTCTTVIGVAADVHRSSVREPAAMQLYIPVGQEVGIGGFGFLVRPRGAATEAITPLALAFRGMPEMPFTSIDLLQTLIDPEFRPWQLGAAMFGVFGAIALIVAAVGLYSVIAYLVADRTRELGVRIALGASSGRIVRDVILTGVATTTTGVVIGLGVALAAGRFIEPMLFDVSARSPIVYGGVSAVVLVIAVVAAWSPARRASRVDPVVALRAD